ncbi:uncharacterized protein LOC133522922 [Cydia pomonella]|uniref:uncharacterized protein LOC133522922 n=1 Tax=Cydia pomonella TaxID=82600 RepID=UPI002ADD392D|nr:uncharacterized protein LOC133522922 [Cydia pomonella]XP_061714389.1 uncharacterized protein LOC133522922 [Cydia pomonella]
MFLVVIITVFIASGESTTLGESDNCDPSELNICVEKIPKTPVGLPKTKEELDTHCRVFNMGMSCMDAWIRRCLPTDGQKLVHQQIGGARAIMRFLCANETTALRREFLKEQSCWARVSPEWSSCVNELQSAVRDISDRAQLFTYFNRNGELCCARDDFMACVTQVGRLCSATAGNLLKRLAWVLAQDVAACSQPHAYCTAPPTAVTTPLLTALSTILLYPPRL